MEMANSQKKTNAGETGAVGELILQNGRQAGARRPLGMPTTFIGRNAGCEMRLNVDGVDPLHCLLVFREDGLELRDLNSVHGSYVNGSRVDGAKLRSGDLIKVGPFQFRLELPHPLPTFGPVAAEVSDRGGLEIQVAAVAAQQLALEEQEDRLEQRKGDLLQQEEQLAAHLAEKQNQIQVWSEYAKSEREALRREKLEHKRELAKLEQEIGVSKQGLLDEQQKLAQDRRRIQKLHQRLRERWHRQWNHEKEKYQKQAREIQADIEVLEERQAALRSQEASLSEQITKFNTERELGMRLLRDGQQELRADQERWRQRRSNEFTVLKARKREMDEAHVKLREARNLLVDEKNAWTNQFESLQKELIGLDRRIQHQRETIVRQDAELARQDRILRERRKDQAAPEPGTAQPDDIAFEVDVEVLGDGPSEAESGATSAQIHGLSQLSVELADQRVHLLEQYQQLVEIQNAWQAQRNRAADELEAMAQRLIQAEQDLAHRSAHATNLEQALEKRQAEFESVRQEVAVWRAQLRNREETIEQENEKRIRGMKNLEMRLQEQLSAVTLVKQRWNRRRQEETERLHHHRVKLDGEHREVAQQRKAVLDKSQKLDEERRILAEKALALEQYRQEVFDRANDPAASKRIERLRRRWLAVNAALIRNAKAERDAAIREIDRMETLREELTKQIRQVLSAEAALTENRNLVDERELKLKHRQMRFDKHSQELIAHGSRAELNPLRQQDEIETMAQAVYEEPDSQSVERAA